MNEANAREPVTARALFAIPARALFFNRDF
jgi:hypothetical protein